MKTDLKLKKLALTRELSELIASSECGQSIDFYWRDNSKEVTGREFSAMIFIRENNGLDALKKILTTGK